MFSLRQLKAFVLVAENRSFTKAAKLLYMTQPAISAQIKALEERLEVQLLERNDKNITLTEAGQIFYEEAYKIIALHEGFVEVINELKGVRRGRVSMAASTIPGEYVLPMLIGEFGRLYPGLDLSLKIVDTGTVADLLLNRSVDIGMIGAQVKDEAIYHTEFMQDELIIINGPAEEDRVLEYCPDELFAADFILRETETKTEMATQ